MKFLSKIAAACMLAVISKVAVALPILTPSGLNPGDTYQLAFVTSTTRDALSANIADYNAHVQAAADAAWHSGGTILDGVQWTAIGSTALVDARDNAFVAGPVYNLGDTRVADGFVDMWDGSLDAPISLNEYGLEVKDVVYTGSIGDGTGPSNVTLGADAPLTGVSQSGGNRCWVNCRIFFSGDLRLYALSGVLTVPTGQAPTPATLALFGLGLVGMGISRRKRNTIS